jgi:hypothetical protein
VDTEWDPWCLSSEKGVTNWVDRHLAFDEEGNLLRRTVVMA